MSFSNSVPWYLLHFSKVKVVTLLTLFKFGCIFDTTVSFCLSTLIEFFYSIINSELLRNVRMCPLGDQGPVGGVLWLLCVQCVQPLCNSAVQSHTPVYSFPQVWLLWMSSLPAEQFLYSSCHALGNQAQWGQKSLLYFEAFDPRMWAKMVQGVGYCWPSFRVRWELEEAHRTAVQKGS